MSGDVTQRASQQAHHGRGVAAGREPTSVRGVVVSPGANVAGSRDASRHRRRRESVVLSRQGRLHPRSRHSAGQRDARGPADPGGVGLLDRLRRRDRRTRRTGLGARTPTSWSTTSGRSETSSSPTACPWARSQTSAGSGTPTSTTPTATPGHCSRSTPRCHQRTTPTSPRQNDSSWPMSEHCRAALNAGDRRCCTSPPVDAPRRARTRSSVQRRCAHCGSHLRLLDLAASPC